MLGSARSVTVTALRLAAEVGPTIEDTSTVPLSASGRPRTETPPSDGAAACEEAPSSVDVLTRTTGLCAEASALSAAGTALLLLTVGTVVGELAGVTVCSPYDVPSTLIGVTTTLAIASLTVSLVSDTPPTLTAWPATASCSRSSAEVAVPAAGAGASAAAAATGTATAPTTSATATEVARGTSGRRCTTAPRSQAAGCAAG